MVIAVFEDDREYADQLEVIIRQTTNFPTAINTGEAQEVVEFAQQVQGAGLYFLDIVKEESTVGFQIAEQVSALNDNNLIVFLTAYPQKISYNTYYKTKAFTFIYKENPFFEQEICETIQLAEQALSGRCFLIHIGRFETLYLPYQHIYFIETVKGTDKLCIHSQNGQYVIRETLRNIEKKLETQGFARCHRSILINTNQAVRVDKSSRNILFPNGAKRPYSTLEGWTK